MSDTIRTVEVKLGRKITDQSFLVAIQNYFSQNENGGVYIEDMCTSEERGFLRITYGGSDVARQVADRKHKIQGRSLDVRLLLPTYPNKLLLQNVPDGIKGETITKYVKKVTGLEPCETLYGDDPNTVVVSFKEEIADFLTVEEKCQKKKLGGKHITVEAVPVSKCVLVENLRSTTYKERVISYFDSLRRAVWGGVVDRSKVVPLRRTDSQGFYIYFKDHAVVDEILAKDHFIDGQAVKVKLYLPCLGPLGGSTQLPNIPNSTTSQPPLSGSEAWKQPRSQTLRGGLRLNSREKTERSLDDKTPCSDLLESATSLLPDSASKLRTLNDDTFRPRWRWSFREKKEKSSDDNTQGSERLDSKWRWSFREKKETQKVLETLRPTHLRLLVAGSVPEEIGCRYTDLLVKIKQQGISFSGLPGVTQEAQTEIKEILGFMKTQTVKLSEGQKQLIGNPETRQYIEQRIKDNERLAEFEINQNGDVEVCTFSQPDKDCAVKAISTSIVEQRVAFDEDSSALMQTNKWQKLSKKLTTDNPGKLVILPADKQQMLVVGTEDIIHGVTSQIEAFRQKNALQSEVVQCLTYVQRFMEKEIESIEKDLKQYRVQIFHMLDAGGEGGIHVQGTSKGLELSKERLKKLEARVSRHIERVCDSKMVRFLNSRLCRQELDRLEDQFRCIISLEPESQRQQTIGQTTTPGHSASAHTTNNKVFEQRNQLPEIKDFYIYHTGNPKYVKQVLKTLNDHIPKDFQMKKIERKELKSLNSSKEQEIREICRENGVELKLDKVLGELTLSGDGAGVSEAREKIDDMLHQLVRQQLDYMEGKIVRISKLSTSDLPDTWSRKEALVTRVDLKSSSEEYRRVEQSFRATLGAKRVTVSMIERIQNKTRYQQYMVEKERLDAQNICIQNEQTLWHGTAAGAIDSIIKYGFNRSYCGKNAMRFGEGVYFAIESSYSAFNTYSPPDGQGNRHIFQCKVLVGHPTVGTERMKVLPERARGILYDSATDDLQKRSLYVIFSDNQAYPEYLITFTVIEPVLV